MGLLTDFFTPVAQSFVSNYALGKTPGSGTIGGGGRMTTVGAFDSEPGGGLPFVDCIPEPDPQKCGPKPVWKYSCGGYRWIYPKRRRRNQLLSNSDAAGLAKLKGLVGVGKTMDTWIATHS